MTLMFYFSFLDFMSLNSKRVLMGVNKILISNLHQQVFYGSECDRPRGYGIINEGKVIRLQAAIVDKKIIYKKLSILQANDFEPKFLMLVGKESWIWYCSVLLLSHLEVFLCNTYKIFVTRNGVII